MFTKEDCWKKSSNRKSKLVLSTLVTTGMAFKHHISFATYLAFATYLNFGCNRFRITPDIVSTWKLLCSAIWSRCAVQFKSEQTLSPDKLFIHTCCFAQDSIWNMWFCSYAIFLLRDEWMIERFSKVMGAALVGNNFTPILWKFHFSWKKKVTRRGPKFTKH